MSVSKFELEIFNNILSSIAEEMGTTLIRAAFSPNIKERKDLSCALFSSSGDMIAQAAHIPVHLGSMSFSVSAIIENEDINEGDVFILNDPFKGGTHLPDITCIAPVYIKDTLEFFVASRAHHADIGGKTPGSMPLSTTIHEEGLIISPGKLYDRGEFNDGLFNRILNSTRDPVEREGDFNAQLASLHTGQRRLVESIEKYGLETIKEASVKLLNYSESIMRSVINSIPNGVYTFKD
ncbi:MAG TPA: hydantoinase B/oxoprolinase family protein, partial [Bacteroidales bacterium]|nr:hydantoinase B/oxoprolinase family protein [Bacteroidales bacterium]